MDQSPLRARSRVRQPAPSIEALEDRVLLSAAAPPVIPPSNPTEVFSAWAAARSAAPDGYPATFHTLDAEEASRWASLGDDRDAADHYDRHQDEARQQALDAILSVSLAAGRSISSEGEGAHRVGESLARNETYPTSPAAESVATSPPASPGATSPPASPGAAERVPILALLPWGTRLADLAGDAPAWPAPDQPAGSVEAGEAQIPAVSPGNPPTADLVRAAALLLDTPPFDLSAVQGAVDGFFAHLADLGQGERVGITLPLVPAVLVATALAYECGRRWGLKKVAMIPPAEDFGADLSEE
jgi:hypothetical protein